jgi:acyl-CoA synthetase (AMP-forming)/AMP-acid ligase II
MVSALVPTTIYDLVHDDGIAPQSLASLRLAGTGAAGLADSLRSAFEAKFGVRPVGTYGMTEAPGVPCQLPAIRDVAVVAEPDDRLGQRIIAFVEPTSGITVDGAQLRQQARGVLAHGKVPDEFIVCMLPRNAMGKVSRGQLRRP